MAKSLTGIVTSDKADKTIVQSLLRLQAVKHTQSTVSSTL